ncbi:transcription initiation factor iia subunit 2 [Anaeramoeba flamelloides]|uniref:Transcription initiation factor iia subunit n=1 Tax=Anaeramoeba flamelloides TaxID=1746091 RepID=A0AAV7YC05_9EUKA|nr:transcription initiation factor iia subunit [Anaeramoeba flamelloides]KAJ6242820.1 transcription initiation factor iia subunit 2 [Anaeramoeba flamelloides]
MSNTSNPNLSLYRSTTLGRCLKESLDELVKNKKINQRLANKVLSQFDQSFSDKIENNTNSRMRVQGRVRSYRNYLGLWSFVLKDAVIKYKGNEVFDSDNLRVVAYDGSSTSRIRSSTQIRNKTTSSSSQTKQSKSSSQVRNGLQKKRKKKKEPKRKLKKKRTNKPKSKRTNYDDSDYLDDDSDDLYYSEEDEGEDPNSDDSDFNPNNFKH